MINRDECELLCDLGDAKRLYTVTAEDLLLMPLAPIAWVVENLIPTGLIILAGAPKAGKSFLAMELAYCVSFGRAFLDHEVNQGTVLYLGLEDTFSRLQRRSFSLADEGANNLHFATTASMIDDNLVNEIGDFTDEHPDTKLIVVDTMQTVRGSSTENAYSRDYRQLRHLKSFSEKRNLALLLVHHTRKLPDENVFNTVAGGVGITGVADETMVLQRPGMFSSKGRLSVTGRDIEASEFELEFQHSAWHMIRRLTQLEVEEREIPACVHAVIEFMLENSTNWTGTATQLAEVTGIDDVNPPVLAKRLNEHCQYLMAQGVKYSNHRTAQARVITLEKIPMSGNDGESKNQ